MNFIEDKELNLKQEGNDLLNGRSYSETLKQIIQNAPEKGTFTIGLFGEWGSGKSSIIKTVKDDLTKNKKEYGNIKFVIYDAWKYVNDSFRRMFLLNLQKELGLGRTDLMEKFYCNITTDKKIELKLSTNHFTMVSLGSLFALIVSVILMTTMKNGSTNAAINATFIVSLMSLLTSLIFKCFNELKTSLNTPYLFAPEQFDDCFKDIISKVLKENAFKTIKNWVTGNKKSDKLIIVIDNIDRCNCETAYELLTNIKNFMGDYNDLIFIIPIDDKALKKHLINDKNEDKDAEEFLRKFFNVELRIKPLENVELFDFANRLNTKHQLNLTPDTINIVANEYATNPRRIIQLFNNLSAELNILSQNCDEKFLKENQSIICKALIIREEWSEYYNLIKKDNKLLKVKNYEPSSNSDPQKYKELNMFLNKTYCLTSDTKLPVIEKILSNSNAFHELPKTIIDSVALSNIKQLIEYVQASSENLELSIKYLLDRLEKSINRKTYGSETVQMFVSLLAINENNNLTSTNNKKIQTAISGQIKNFLTYIPEEYFSFLTQYINDLNSNNYLIDEINQYMEESLKEDDETDNFAYKLYKSILLNCNDIKNLKNKFKIWYSISDTNLPDLDIKDKIQSVLTDELIIFILSRAANTNEDSWVFDDLEYLAQYGKLSEKQKDLIFTFFNSKTPAFNGSNAQELLNALRFITKILKYIKINGNQSFMNFYENTFRQQQVSYRQQTILQTVTSEDDLKTIIDFLILTYISGYNVPATQDKLKILFDTYPELQSYILASIKNICDKGIQIFPLQYIVFKTSEISETSLFLLSKIVKEKDDNGKYHIEDSSVKTKLDYLVKNLVKEEYNVQINKFFENNIDDSRIKDLLVKTISSANRETIISLSLKLQSIAFDKICEDIQLYKNEKSLLEAIATSKTKKHISALIQLIKELIVTKNDFEYWKSLYERIDEKSIPVKDKKIIQTVLDAELEEEKEQIA